MRIKKFIMPICLCLFALFATNEHIYGGSSEMSLEVYEDGGCKPKKGEKCPLNGQTYDNKKRQKAGSDVLEIGF